MLWGGFKAQMGIPLRWRLEASAAERNGWGVKEGYGSTQVILLPPARRSSPARRNQRLRGEAGVGGPQGLLLPCPCPPHSDTLVALSPPPSARRPYLQAGYMKLAGRGGEWMAGRKGRDSEGRKEGPC